MKLSQELFDGLTARAKESPRLRMNLDLRNSPEDGSQRMLIIMSVESTGVSVAENKRGGGMLAALEVGVNRMLAGEMRFVFALLGTSL